MLRIQNDELHLRVTLIRLRLVLYPLFDVEWLAQGDAAVWLIWAVARHHRDAVVDGAHRQAQRAAGAIRIDHFWDVGIGIEGDGLVATVIARGVATAAVDAHGRVDLRDHLLGLAESVPLANTGNSAGNQLADGCDGAIRLRGWSHLGNGLQFGGAQGVVRFGGALRRQSLLVLLRAFTELVLQLAVSIKVHGLANLVRRRHTGELTVPVRKIGARLQVNERLQPAEVVGDDARVLVLDCRANLHGASASHDELERSVGGVATSGRKNREARQCASNGGDVAQSNWSDGVAADTTVRCALLFADLGPGRTVGRQVHQTRHRVGGSDSCGTTFLRGASDVDDLGDVRGKLGEDRDAVASLRDPSADGAHHVGILATRHAHALFAHAVGAGKVQLQPVSASCRGASSELLPVRFVERGHDGGNERLVREVALQLFDGLDPVLLGLLRNQLNVQETLLVRTEVPVAASRSANNTRGDVGNDILVDTVCLRHVEAPSVLVSTADERRSASGRSRREAKWVGEFDSSNVHGQVHEVNRSGELGHRLCQSFFVARSQELVNASSRHLTVVGSLDGRLGHTGKIASAEDSLHGGGLGFRVHYWKAPLVHHRAQNFRVGQRGSERGNHVVGADRRRFVLAQRPRSVLVLH
mmetsp:Transcript_27773/g.41073  ORF Transcript_27773/g.41073 Transcript_27773/m.41073 type:complete len:642 (+) Transcript_27773:23-1948(+)